MNIFDILSSKPHNSCSTEKPTIVSVNKVLWSQDEKEQLMELYKQHELSVDDISKFLNKTIVQCRKTWYKENFNRYMD